MGEAEEDAGEVTEEVVPDPDGGWLPIIRPIQRRLEVRLTQHSSVTSPSSDPSLSVHVATSLQLATSQADNRQGTCNGLTQPACPLRVPRHMPLTIRRLPCPRPWVYLVTDG